MLGLEVVKKLFRPSENKEGKEQPPALKEAKKIPIKSPAEQAREQAGKNLGKLKSGSETRGATKETIWQKLGLAQRKVTDSELAKLESRGEKLGKAQPQNKPKPVSKMAKNIGGFFNSLLPWNWGKKKSTESTSNSSEQKKNQSLFGRIKGYIKKIPIIGGLFG